LLLPICVGCRCGVLLGVPRCCGRHLLWV
jgi:hypothetical protein